MAEFRLLGPVEVWAAGRPLELGPAKQRLVLAALLVDARHPVAIDTLIDRVWDDRPPAKPHAVLYGHLARIRRLLAQATAADGSPLRLVRRSGGYVLDVTPGQLDVDRFRDLVANARAPGCPDEQRAERLRDALALWRGQPLAGLAGEWVARVREGFAQQRLSAALAWAEVELRLGHHGVVTDELVELVAEYPLAEPLIAWLLRALHLGGRTAEALDCYARTRQRLADELGVEPGPELSALHTAMLRGTLDRPDLSTPGPTAALGSTAHRVIPAQLPADVAGFAGRSEHLRQLDALLADDRQQDDRARAVVITAIAGTAGVGKTALAVHWAHRVAERFPDGQLYVNLHGWAPGPPVTPLQALVQVLGALGVDADKMPVEADQAAGLYRSLLSGRRVLVVVDNARDAEQVRPLLPGSPDCVVLVTSRDRLGGLVASHGARRLTLDVLAPDEAVTLLAGIVGKDRVQAEPVAAAELAHACALLPLALRIAAANLTFQPDQPLAGYLARLRAGDQLAELVVDGDPHAAVRAAFDCSYVTLDSDAQRLFRLLGLMPGRDFTAEAAAAVARLGVGQAARLVEHLATAHLVEPHRSGRFGFHELLRLYAAERAGHEDSEAERGMAVRRLLAWYLHTADAAVRLLYPQTLRLPFPPADPELAVVRFDKHAAALEWLDAERANLVAAVQHAAALGPRPIAWLLADALRGYFWDHRSMVDWLTLADAALSAAEAEGDLRAQAAAQRTLGQARKCLGDHTQATEHLASALVLARQAGWADGEAAALGNLGHVHQELGQLRQAADDHAQALALYQQTGYEAGQATALGNLGYVYLVMGWPKKAADHAARALALYREIGSQGGQAATLSTLGEATRDLGQLHHAKAHLTHALTLAQDHGDRYDEAWGLHALATVQRDLGQLAPALELAEAALGLAREISELQLAVAALNTLGSIRLCLGQHQQATQDYQEALELARQTNARYPETETLLGLAAACQHQGRHPKAIQHAGQALTLARTGGFRIMEGRAHSILAGIHLDLDRYDLAVRHTRQALGIHRETGHRLGEARALVMLGHALRSTDGLDIATSCWQQALVLFTDIDAAEAEQVCALLDERVSSS